MNAKSTSEKNRNTGKHQVDVQKVSILDSAERLFIKNGLDNTRMIDIANQAGITRVTLYRYFANRDEIALEIQLRMMNRINSLVDTDNQEPILLALRRRAQAMIRNFDELRNAYRYIGMFDKIYLDNAYDLPLTHWTKSQLSIRRPRKQSKINQGITQQQEMQVGVILSTVIWFLEKLALRGELTWSDSEIPLHEYLRIFESLIMRYFDELIEQGKVNFEK